MPRLESTGVLWVLIHSNAALIFITTILLELIFQLVGLRATCMAAFNQDFNHQSLFMFTLIPRSTYFLLVRKIMLFSYEKVVLTQFDTCRWFYPPIYAEWLPLNRWKGNNNWSNFSNLHRSEILPQSEISDRFEFTSGLM